MESSIVVTINAGAPGCNSRRRPAERDLEAAYAAVALPSVGDAEALAFSHEIDRLQRQIAALSVRQTDADEAARRRLARELHDCVGAELAATRFALANMETWLPADAPPQCTDALALVRRSLDAACEATREVLAGLHAPRLDAGLVRALSDWIGGFGTRTGLRTSFVCAADVRLARLPADAALAVFRVGQEALANVARHARAASAGVRLDTTPRRLTLSVTDDGVGLARGARRRTGHYGIAGMRDRCAALGGTLRITSARAAAGERRGTTVRASFTWDALLRAGAVHALNSTGARS